jgi:hypothetical protein
MQLKRSEKTTGAGDSPACLTRRELNRALSWSALGLLAGTSGWAAQSRASDPAPSAPGGANPSTPRQLPIKGRPEIPTSLLEKSPFVYISPLHANGRESTCHAELWYAWLDEAVVVTVAADRWKAGALARGLDRARIWVGDHGRWKTWYGGRNDGFRAGPHFDARAERVTDPTTLDRLLAVYEDKYPEEVADWIDVMREGNADGSRIVLRYTAAG